MPTRRVNIVRDAVQVRVIPPVQTANRNDTVEFKAQNTPAKLFFPDKTVFESAGVDVEVLDIASGATGTVTVQADAPFGVLPYAVYCSDIADFAVGGSPPTMIIE